MERKLKIALEGPNKTGKSTIHKLLKAKYPTVDIVDRSIVSDIVYNKMFKRDRYMGVDVDTYERYWLQFHENNTRLKIVLFTADTKELARRSIQAEEPFARNRNFEEVCAYLGKEKKYFKDVVDWYDDSFVKVVKVDTTNDSIEQTLQKIEEETIYGESI